MQGLGRAEADASESPSTAVIFAVAEHEGVDPKELHPPLYEAIDPDALNRLFPDEGTAGRPHSSRVTFAYRGHVVEVTSDGDVRVFDEPEY